MIHKRYALVMFGMAMLVFAPWCRAAGTVSVCDLPHFLVALQGGGSVTFSCSGTIELTSTIGINQSTSISGAGQNVTIAGNGTFGLLVVDAVASTVDLTSLTLSGSGGSSGGALVTEAGAVNVTSCTFQNNKNQNYGAAIFNTGATLTVTQSQFIHNSTSFAGGAIAAFEGTSTVFFSTLTDNFAPYGGAVYVGPVGTASLFFNTFTSNSAVDGGAIFVASNPFFLGTLNLGASTFTDNTAGNFGGAMYNAGATIIESWQLFGPPGQGSGRGAVFTSNTAQDDGGAIAQAQNGSQVSSITIYNSQFSSNSAGGGGAIANLGGTLSIINSTLSNNTTTAGEGGGIFNTQIGTGPIPVTTVQTSTLSGNTAATLGGAISSHAPSQLSVNSSTFFGNQSKVGGAIENTGPLTVINSTFFNNIAPFGAAIGNNSMQAIVTYSTIYENLPGTGSIYGSAPLLLESTIIAGESASNGISNCQTAPIDGGYNFEDGSSCHFISALHSSSDIVCPIGISAIPCLSPLAFNGGPTETLGVPAGSPLIGKIPKSVNGCGTTVPTDQRGVTRPQDVAGCTIGSVEHLFVNVPPSGTQCNGSYNKTFTGDITVLPGQSCDFVGGGVTGNVQVQGGHFGLSTATVTGNVEVYGDSSFSIDAFANIGGNLEIHNLPASAAQNEVCGANVTGSVQFHDNAASVQIGSTNPLLCAGNTISGDLDVHNNSASTKLDFNIVGGSLTDHNNFGPTQVIGNTVKSVLDCHQDVSITGNTNVAGQKQGQCAAF